jgi:hypothetical protein
VARNDALVVHHHDAAALRWPAHAERGTHVWHPQRGAADARHAATRATRTVAQRAAQLAATAAGREDRGWLSPIGAGTIEGLQQCECAHVENAKALIDAGADQLRIGRAERDTQQRHRKPGDASRRGFL